MIVLWDEIEFMREDAHQKRLPASLAGQGENLRRKTRGRLPSMSLGFVPLKRVAAELVYDSKGTSKFH